eukprot:CFRG3080T1
MPEDLCGELVAEDDNLKDSTTKPSYVLFKSDEKLFPLGTESTTVYYDEGLQQVLVVRWESDSANVSLLTYSTDSVSLTFRIPHTASVSSIKLSTDLKLVAVQRTANMVEFFDPLNTSKAICSILGRYTNTKVLGFYWLHERDMVLITENTVELYQLRTDGRSFMLMKYYVISPDWFIFSHSAQLLVLSSKSHPSLYTYSFFKAGSVTRLSRVDYLGSSRGIDGHSERDIGIVRLYGKLYITRIRNHVLRGNQSGMEVELFHVMKEAAVKDYVLYLNLSSSENSPSGNRGVGNFALSVVDNHIVVHHQETQTCYIFDVLHTESAPTAKSTTPNEQSLSYGSPSSQPNSGSRSTSAISSPVSPSQFIYPLTEGTRPQAAGNEALPTSLYRTGWILFQPNVVLDSRTGRLWRISVSVEQLASTMSPGRDRIEYLLRRRGAKELLKTSIVEFVNSVYLLSAPASAEAALKHTAALEMMSHLANYQSVAQLLVSSLIAWRNQATVKLREKLRSQQLVVTSSPIKKQPSPRINHRFSLLSVSTTSKSGSASCSPSTRHDALAPSSPQRSAIDDRHMMSITQDANVRTGDQDDMMATANLLLSRLTALAKHDKNSLDVINMPTEKGSKENREGDMCVNGERSALHAKDTEVKQADAAIHDGRSIGRLLPEGIGGEIYEDSLEMELASHIAQEERHDPVMLQIEMITDVFRPFIDDRKKGKNSIRWKHALQILLQYRRILLFNGVRPIPELDSEICGLLVRLRKVHQLITLIRNGIIRPTRLVLWTLLTTPLSNLSSDEEENDGGVRCMCILHQDSSLISRCSTTFSPVEILLHLEDVAGVLRFLHERKLGAVLPTSNFLEKRSKANQQGECHCHRRKSRHREDE